MKNFALLSAFLFSFNAFATGGFSCEATAKQAKAKDLNAQEVKVLFNATTSRVYGSPIVSTLKVSIDGQEKFEFTKDFITGYWNSNYTLQILALDENYDSALFEVNYFKPANRGILTLNIDGSKYIAHNLTCEFE